MTATAAPVLTAHSAGDVARLSWPAVPLAATYNVYAGATASTTTLVEAGITALVYQFYPLNVASYIRVTAVNAGAEESDYSNEVRLNMSDAGRRLNGPYRSPFG